MVAGAKGLFAGAVAVLESASPGEKLERTATIARAWRARELPRGNAVAVPERPARPDRPVLLPAREMPRRRATGGHKTFALLHSVAHIELNAIDLAWDLIARFGPALPDAALDDWVTVAAEEALHFELLSRRMAELGGSYGDLPAHDGLWQAAIATSGDLLARLAVVPLVLEARGLDVTPGMIETFGRHGDGATVAVLERIYRDEIGHVAAGMRWFIWACERVALPPCETWQSLVGEHFKGALKPPFNTAGRDAADFPARFYQASGIA